MRCVWIRTPQQNMRTCMKKHPFHLGYFVRLTVTTQVVFCRKPLQNMLRMAFLVAYHSCAVAKVCAASSEDTLFVRILDIHEIAERIADTAIEIVSR